MESDHLMLKLGLKRHSTGSKGPYWNGPCPFEKAGTDRFYFYEQTQSYYCRKCHQRGDRNATGTIGWLNYNFGDRNVKFTRPTPVVQEIPLPDYTNHVSLDYIREAKHTNRLAVHQYYGVFGISTKACDEWDLGYVFNGDMTGYVIPRKMYLEEGTDPIYMGAEIRLIKPMNKMKYLSVTGSQMGGWSNNKLVTIPGHRRGPEIDYLLITESAKDAILLNDLGFNASAYKHHAYWNSVMQECLSNVACPIIVQDNDWRWDAGLKMEVSPGKDIADKVARLMGKRQCLRVSTPNHKQPSDLAADAGRDAVKSWLLDSVKWLRE